MEEGIADVELDGDEDLLIAARDFKKVAESRTKSGYVEGVEAGKNEGLKEGFGEGFISGLTASSPWASLRGRILAVNVWCQSGREHRALTNKRAALLQLEELSADVKTAEEKWRAASASAKRETYHKELSFLREGWGEDDVSMEIEGPSISGTIKSTNVEYGDLFGSCDVTMVNKYRTRLKDIISTLS